MANIYQNLNDPNHIHEAQNDYDNERLGSLPNWELLEGKARDRALARLHPEGTPEPAVISEIGEVSEQYNEHGAGEDHNPDALNEDKLSHAGDSDKDGQEPDALEDLPVKELREYAKDNEIDLGGAKSKAEILDLIRSR